MKKLILIMSIMGLASCLLADTNYHFVADIDTDNLIKSFKPNNKTYPSYRVVSKDDGTPQTRYHVIVTEPQFNAGWNALDPSIKAAAKDAVEDEIKDIDQSFDKLQRAMLEAFRDLINQSRTNITVKPIISKGQLKQLIKDKF